MMFEQALHYASNTSISILWRVWAKLSNTGVSSFGRVENNICVMVTLALPRACTLSLDRKEKVHWAKPCMHFVYYVFRIQTISLQNALLCPGNKQLLCYNTACHPLSPFLSRRLPPSQRSRRKVSDRRQEQKKSCCTQAPARRKKKKGKKKNNNPPPLQRPWLSSRERQVLNQTESKSVALLARAYRELRTSRTAPPGLAVGARAPEFPAALPAGPLLIWLPQRGLLSINSPWCRNFDLEGLFLGAADDCHDRGLSGQVSTLPALWGTERGILRHVSLCQNRLPSLSDRGNYVC